VSSAGVEANGRSSSSALSADGRFVAFSSAASNLVAGDTNGYSDIFVRDRRTGITRRVSVSSNGVEGNEDSGDPAISADGRFVAFSSDASSLVTGDGNNARDVFVRDRRTGTTRRVSVSSAGAEGNGESLNGALSASGRFIAFDSLASNIVSGDTNGYRDVFVRDRRTGLTRRVSVSSAGAAGNQSSFGPVLSADGRFVVFASAASNLVARDTNGFTDVFLRDRRAGTTRRVSVNSRGVGGGGIDRAISGDGRFVAFVSGASNLVPYDENGSPDVFVRGPLRR
jgi:Tol biopolymer transport system component